jgi:hypothetical protein
MDFDHLGEVTQPRPGGKIERPAAERRAWLPPEPDDYETPMGVTATSAAAYQDALCWRASRVRRRATVELWPLEPLAFTAHEPS